jgi:heparosan-N-sulfate-glucuronate 5-epimerase
MKAKHFFMLKRLFTDLIENRHLKIEKSIDQLLTYYYLRFDLMKINSRGGNKPFEFDENGIPKIHSYIDVKEKGFYYYPITIGQFGLGTYHQYLDSGDECSKKQFLKIVNWFTENLIEEDLLGAFWLTEVPKPEFKITTPWKSAFTQSRAISVLLRGWQMTRESNYLKLASKALIPFTIPIESGGVAVDLTEEMAFYEEYVAEKPTRILDGAMFSLFGVYDFIRATKELKEWEESHQLAKEIFRKGVNGLKFWLPKFDMGYWVFYNRCEIEGYPQNDPCTIGYLRLVSAQLEIMANLTGEKIFIEYSYKFKGYLKPWNILKMYREKFIALKKLNRL